MTFVPSGSTADASGSERKPSPDAVLAEIVRARLREQVRAYVEGVHLPPGARVLELLHGEGRATCTDVDGWRVTRVALRDDLESLDEPDDTFDLVIVGGALELLEYDYWMLQEVRRVLKPGGHLILSVPNARGLRWTRNPFVRLAAKIDNRVTRHGGQLRHALGGRCPVMLQDPQVDPRTGRKRRYYVRNELLASLRRLDMPAVESTTVGHGPLPFVRHSRLLSRRGDSLLRRWGGLGGEVITLLASKPMTPRSTTRLEPSELVESRIEPAFIQTRDAWLARHPEQSHGEVCEWKQTDFPPRALVFSPHPDDEIIACGGTIARMMAAGTRVTVVQVTRGNACHALRFASRDEQYTSRLREAEEVAALMQFDELVLWRELDRSVPTDTKAVDRTARLIDRVCPDLILLPFVPDPHPDHVSTNLLVAQAVRRMAQDPATTRIAGCEIATLVSPNRVCGIDETWDLKCRALMKYRAGMKAIDFISLCERHHAHHAWHSLKRRGLVEAFFEMTAEAYADLVMGEHGGKITVPCPELVAAMG